MVKRSAARQGGGGLGIGEGTEFRHQRDEGGGGGPVAVVGSAEFADDERHRGNAEDIQNDRLNRTAGGTEEASVKVFVADWGGRIGHIATVVPIDTT